MEINSQLQRSAGVLLHITCLPSSFGIGDLGAGARRFVEFLSSAGQRVWQVLPLGPTVIENSPYSCYSAFAGNPLLISLEDLVEDGLLSDEQIDALHADYLNGLDRQSPNGSQPVETQACNFELARPIKMQGLELAFDRFLNGSACESFDIFEEFCTLNKFWLDDFALFAALMQHFGTDDWTTWEPGLVSRDAATMNEWRERLSKSIEFEQFIQFVFFRQWSRLRGLANSRKVQLFGDMPIFVSRGSSDVWANQDCFSLNADGQPTVVAGVPPDYFSKTGQLWGNPLYDWQSLQNTQYRWWTDRFRVAFQLFDVLRIDHFRGFEAYWEVPATAQTAQSGKWTPGPGVAPFAAAQRALGDLPIVAEDLGMITDEVHALRDTLGFPGMRVLQFGFDQASDDYHRPSAYPDNSVAYTGTHDNAPIVSWFNDHQDNELFHQLLSEYGVDANDSDNFYWNAVKMVYESRAYMAIIPFQDLLGLGEESRMNVPGRASGNWGWRCLNNQLNEALAARMRELALATDRFQHCSSTETNLVETAG